jgi:hypothetical protein
VAIRNSVTYTSLPMSVIRLLIPPFKRFSLWYY